MGLFVAPLFHKVSEKEKSHYRPTLNNDMPFQGNHPTLDKHRPGLQDQLGQPLY